MTEADLEAALLGQLAAFLLELGHGQLITYVSDYPAHEKTAGDQPSVGFLLCTGKNLALVECALAGLDNRLFVSNDQLALPRLEELQRYIDEQRRLFEEGKA